MQLNRIEVITEHTSSFFSFFFFLLCLVLQGDSWEPWGETSCPNVAPVPFRSISVIKPPRVFCIFFLFVFLQKVWENLCPSFRIN